jgi:hypothetical protein
MFPPQNCAPSDSFVTTPWSLLSTITRPDDLSPEEEKFVDRCAIFWRPICCFIRAHGYEERVAREMAKFFFAGLLAQRQTDPDTAPPRLRIYIHDNLKQYLVAAGAARRKAWRRNSMLE